MNTPLTREQNEALFSICLLAAFADGEPAEEEKVQLQRISTSLLGEDLHASEVFQNVLQQKTVLTDVAPRLAGSSAAHSAFEMAVCVCDADEVLSEPEKSFLAQLQNLLGLETGETADITEAAGQLAISPVQNAPALPDTAETDDEADKLILKYALLNGALEFLPEKMATLAIIPMQMKMVYSVGKIHGVELDRKHIMEFAAAAGLGFTSQVVEGFARKWITGFFGKKEMVKNVADQATGSAMTFATTYALGKAAKAYYAGGRKMVPAELKSVFDSTVSKAREMHAQFLPKIREQASKLDIRKLISEAKA